MYIFAQVIIVISSVLYGASAFAKNKKLLFVIQIAGSGTYATYCFLMGAISGGIMSVMDTLRVVIFYIIEKFNGTQKTKNIFGVILLAVGIVGTVNNWGGWFSIFPPLGSVTYVLSLIISNLMFIKFSTLFNAICSSAYMFFAGAKVGAITELIAVVIALAGFVKAIVNKVKTKKEYNK